MEEEVLQIKELGVSKRSGAFAEFFLAALKCSLKKICPIRELDISSSSANPFKKRHWQTVSRALKKKVSLRSHLKQKRNGQVDYVFLYTFIHIGRGSTGGKQSTCWCRRCKRRKFDPELGRSPGEGHGNPLQYSCLKNPMDRGGLQSMGPQSRTLLSDWAHKHTRVCVCVCVKYLRY